jgi:hypothetical protein
LPNNETEYQNEIEFESFGGGKIKVPILIKVKNVTITPMIDKNPKID